MEIVARLQAPFFYFENLTDRTLFLQLVAGDKNLRLDIHDRAEENTTPVGPNERTRNRVDPLINAYVVDGALPLAVNDRTGIKVAVTASAAIVIDEGGRILGNLFHLHYARPED